MSYSDWETERRRRAGEVMTTRTFEARIKELEMVGKRRPDQPQRREWKVRPWHGWQRAHIPLLTDEEAADPQGFKDSGRKKGVEPMGYQFPIGRQPVEPWFNAASQESPAVGSALPDIAASPRTPSLQGSSSSRMSTADSRHRVSDGNNIEQSSPQAPLLPRPAMPDIPSASAACWPAGQARWRWKVQTESIEEAESLAPTEEAYFPDSYPTGSLDAALELLGPKARKPSGIPWWQIPGKRFSTPRSVSSSTSRPQSTAQSRPQSTPRPQSSPKGGQFEEL
eukprot:TRINITY_DN40597_c0_g1_i1.p1 TRINITY_DN40597_c0_g1~~TRINITY_DN40597_c0_g1_i1.p1  ORF type:complete len:281 (+),score=38.58 TRINITY_DN40597_c0_g1_i1:85-927(+)